MRPIYLSLALAAAVAFSACDPVEDDYSDNISVVSADQINATVQVVKENGKNVNGVVVDVVAKNPVQISNGVNTVYSSHAELTLFGTGENTVYVTEMNPDLSTVTKEFKVMVDEMSDNFPVLPQYGLLTNNSQKKWKWACERTTCDYVNPPAENGFRGVSWGSFGWCNPKALLGEDHGADVWWGAAPAELEGQLSHSPTGKVTGEENPDAYMIFSLNGTKIETYAADGTLIRSGKFDLSSWGKKVAAWSEGTLVTSAESILFPWEINMHGYAPTDFDVIELTENSLVLVCCTPEKQKEVGGITIDDNGINGEGTFWRFVAAE